MRFIKSFVIVAVVIAALAGTVNAISAPNDVMVTDYGEISHYLTRVETIGEFLEENHFVIGENDRINVSLDEKILPGCVNKLTITRGIDIEVHMDNIAEIVNVPQGTYSGTLIRYLETKYNKEYVYEGKRSEVLIENQIFELKTASGDALSDIDLELKNEIATEQVPYETIYVFDETLSKGKVVITQKGVMGIKEIVTVVRLLDGQPVDADVIEERITQQPVTRIVKQGTKEIDSETVEVFGSDDKKAEVGAIVMNASAYTLNESSTGKKPGNPGYGITASGMRAQRGVVAVDPEVIPLGTKLYVEGYGYAVAGDTGGSIKGKKIDLFFETNSECIQFGRRDIVVHVLDDGDNAADMRIVKAPVGTKAPEADKPEEEAPNEEAVPETAEIEKPQDHSAPDTNVENFIDIGGVTVPRGIIN